ncbi:cytosolic arginine sensor for mTORC1 subunit 1 isoform X2 [Monodelphis domestica]|uniref:cytosolic arginine sensor for mTORC1 subunit 1 isoform X2 n=1 Tax=Monodelphis domestica TaxID=13616 RepID=UPI0024E2333B|nr:cytosolic arginine sensor for mTORC1 subunit 1 isoform X2 [Monodelphis domestica]
MELHILEHRVRVLSIARPGLWLYTHPLVKLLFLRQRSRCKFFSLTETPEDYTLMLDEEGYKELPPSEFLQVAEATWLVLNVLSNSSSATNFQAVGVTKIARSVISPLAEHHVSVLMLSTYQTDFILDPAPPSTPSRAPRTDSASSRWTPTPSLPSPPRSWMSCSTPTALPKRGLPMTWTSTPSPSSPSRASRAISLSSWTQRPRRSSPVTCYSPAPVENSGEWFESGASPWALMSVASWPRLLGPWPLPTSPPTTSAPSTSTTPWYLRMASTASSRSYRIVRRAAGSGWMWTGSPCASTIVLFSGGTLAAPKAKPKLSM